MQNIIAAIFKNESEGYQALSELSNKPVTDQTTVMEMVLVKRENNSFKVCENYDSGSNTTDDMLVGGLCGGLIGILGGPVGVLLLGSYGALVGGAVDSVDAVSDQALIEKVAQKMIDGEFALIVLAEEENEAIIDSLLGKFDVEIARFDAAVIAAEIEEAERVQKEMDRLARQELRNTKKAERKEKVEAKRAKIHDDFEAFKAKHKPQTAE